MSPVLRSNSANGQRRVVRRSSPRITAFIAQKGGVQKTTTTLQVGVALADLGKKVLIIDGDPQCSLTLSAGLEATDLPASLWQVLQGNIALDDAITRSPLGVDVVGANIRMATFDRLVAGQTHPQYQMRAALESSVTVPSYDHILIDCQPHAGSLTINMAVAARELVIPTGLDTLSLDSMINVTLEMVSQVREARPGIPALNPNLNVLGVVATRVNLRSVRDREGLMILRQRPDLPILAVIMDSVHGRRAMDDLRPIVRQEGAQVATLRQAYERLAGILCGAVSVGEDPMVERIIHPPSRSEKIASDAISAGSELETA